jgi:2-phosphoglycerate kinase
MHAILFGSQLLIEFLNLLQTKTKNLNDAAYKLALVVSEVLKGKGGQERTKEELLKLKDTLEEAKKENEEFKEA